MAGRLSGATITGTKVDPEAAELQKPHEGKPFHIVVEQIDPEDLFPSGGTLDAIEPGYGLFSRTHHSCNVPPM